MTRPGVNITSVAVRPRRGAPTDTGTAFFVGPTSTGPTTGFVKIERAADYAGSFGSRTGAAANISDAVELFFAEGGSVAYIARTVTGGTPRTVTDALGAFPADLGPGQVLAPGDSTTATWGALLTHAADTNRTALLDAAQDADATALDTAATTVQGLANAHYGGLWAGWPQIGAAAGGTGLRAVPPSALIAGLIARQDAATGDPTEAPAGNAGYSRIGVGVSGPVFTDAQRTALTADGVNTVRVGFDGVQNYGFRSTTLLPEWSQLTAHRTRMMLVARLRALGEQFLFRGIDGQGFLLAEFAGTLTGELNRLYLLGALFGENADDAYLVDVGPAVNTPASIAAGELHAVVLARVSPFAEQVAIDLVFTDNVAA